MDTRNKARTGVGLTVAVTTAGLTLGVPAGSQARSSTVDPSTLDRGENPAVTYIVRDTIRDGDLRVPATKRGSHDAIWKTRRGYVLKDVFPRGRGQNPYRLTFVSDSGEKRLIARQAYSVAVSGAGRRVAWSYDVGDYPLRSVVKVANPNTGQVIDTKRFRQGARVEAVTAHRVMLSRLFTATTGTLWWNFRRDTVRKLSDESVVNVDFKNNRIVFDIPRDAPACNRVARYSRPAATLWRSCRWFPHEWSPNGERVLATHTYFDAAGTDRWLTLDGTTGERLSRVNGRLDWDAVWEDNRHFLTLAQGEDGMASIVRCSVDEECERASRLWDIPLPDPSVFYNSPPVTLGER